MIEIIIKNNLIKAIVELYSQEVEEKNIQIQNTRNDFVGDFTIVVFPLLRISKKKPEETANEIGQFLKESVPEIIDFNVIKGFLNVSISASYWLSFFAKAKQTENFGYKLANDDSPLIMIEYSSPNTNKPLHLGHIRNNLLGFSLSKIMAANGYKVFKTNIVNDRGIHICKSMLAWEKWGEGETPESTGIKGDHLVGKYYVRFDKEYKQEIALLVSKGMDTKQAAKEAPLMKEAQKMLKKWERENKKVRKLWSMMNQWVYDGFDISYKKLGVDFDEIYYESNTYLLGKDIVLRMMKQGQVEIHDDTSIWADLTADGLDKKILLRSDGTSVYMTQDIGTAIQRYEDYNFTKHVYVVGNEQEYHFKVLKLILKRFGYDWSDSLQHLSYGMVELPDGKMKSREGTVVDADDLIDTMINTARETSEELGKLENYSSVESEKIFYTIAMGALKYFILKVDPKKNMTFNPDESIDFNGNTGPFIQYTYARIQSILRKAKEAKVEYVLFDETNLELSKKEIQLLKLIYTFPQTLADAGENQSPALIANFTYDLVKEYNQFYHDYPIWKEEQKDKRNFRLGLSDFVAKLISSSMDLLGIAVPERM